jgi:hypothetical protein
MELDPVQRFAIEQVGRALEMIPISDADHLALEKIADAISPGQNKFFFTIANDNNIPITPGLWTFYMSLIASRWGDKEQETAVTLPTLRELYRESADPKATELLDGAAEALEALSWLAYGDEKEVELNEDRPFGLVRGQELTASFFRLAKASELLGDADIAYDLAALALDLGVTTGDLREQVARYALSLGLTAGRMHQVAVISAEVAASVASAADTAIERRLEAFDCCETALERLSLAPEGFREIAARRLAEIVRERIYLRSLLPPIFSFLPPEEQPSGLTDILGFTEWPERVSAKARQEWVASLNAILQAQFWDLEVEKARLALEPAPKSDKSHADWTALTIDHAAYRRAVPQHRSFLREAELDRNLLVLTHEITHVLSLIGGIGNALTSLRVAAIDTEATFWSLVPGAEEINLTERIAQEGVAPLASGEIGLLFRAEQGIELTLKAQILQDVWKPWLEGLAIFGEIASDPALDPVGIGPVANCMRNLIDFTPPNSESGAPLDEADIRKAYDQFTAEFEAIYSAAINRHGPVRLSRYCRSSQTPYLAGFVAVRSVVSAWRYTTGRPLTGTETFGLLLHATRFGTSNAIPDLSLRSDLFAMTALEMMADWAQNLTQLTRDEIENFLAPPQRDGPGRIFRWEGCRLVTGTADTSSRAANQRTEVTRRVREALSSLTRQEDVERVSPTGEVTSFLLREGAQILKDNAEELANRRAKLVEHFMTLGTILPIGRTAAKFFVNVDSGASTSYLATQIRTMEAHVSDGNPSINGFWFPIDRMEGELIASSFRQLGSPRLQVTRLIDLGGTLLPSWPHPGNHFLTFSYGGWFGVRGSTLAIDALLNEDIEYKAGVLDLLRTRLYPPPPLRAELEIIAPGKRGAERTRNWISQSASWSIDGYPVEVESWTKYISALAERVSVEEDRLTRQRDAAEKLVSQLIGDAQLAKDLATSDFETLTDNAPDQREALVKALFKTAQRPTTEADVTAAVVTFTSSSLNLFSSGTCGWDVHPATRSAMYQGEDNEPINRS